MMVTDWLLLASHLLTAAGINTARLDALVLLEDCIGRDRATLLAHPEIELSDEQAELLNEQIKRRISHEPLAYIRGKTEFYGRDFIVDHRVLEPRPESETMIDLLKKLVAEKLKDSGHTKISLADIGSGSGCLGITAAQELGLESVTFYDIDPGTLEIAKTNADNLGVQGQFFEGDLLAHDHGPYDILLANLPYVPESFHINEAAMREPNIAIFGGKDGLDLYRRLFVQLECKPWRPKYILTEALPPQHVQLAEMAAHYGFGQMEGDDFIQVFVPKK